MISIRDQFHIDYYNSGVVWDGSTKWRGQHIEKYPSDLISYQEILYECKPDIIIEAGTRFGGSARFLGDICELFGHGKIVSLDVEAMATPEHPRVTYINGDSGDAELASKLMAEHKTADDQKVMVILDSNHTQSHVLRELEAWAKYVSVGQYLVVEDTNINSHPVQQGWGPGPWEALDVWHPNHPEFQIDESREKFLITANPRGWLKRVA